MPKQKQLSIRLNEELYEAAKNKCNEQLGIGLSPLIKVFLKAFTTQRGVGFYIGDEDLSNLFNRWLMKKHFEKDKKEGHRFTHPRLRDLYDL